MSIIIPANSAVSGGFDVANSCMFDGASARMTRTQGSGNRQIFTLSTWFKTAKTNADQTFYGSFADSSNYDYIFLNSSGQMNVNFRASGSNTAYVTTNRLFRDTSAWYHLVVAVDTTQGTEANRIKIYINGVQETSFATATYPSVNTNTTFNNGGTGYVGSVDGTQQYFNGLLAEVVWLDGQALAPTSFGEFDEDSGIWKPIGVSGLTFGTSGFYLDFEDSANLGNDASGGTDFSETNIAAGDQSTDTCTNNYNVLTPLNKFGSHTLSEGNTRLAGDTGYNHQGTTFGVNKGKWYVEIKHAQTRSKVFMLSLYNVDNTIYTQGSDLWFNIANGLTTFYLQLQNTNHASTRDYTFRKMVGTTQTTVTSTGGNLSGLSVGIIGVYIDMDNKRIHFYNNGSALDGHNAASSTAGLGAIPAGTYALGLTDVRAPDGGDDGVLLMDWNFGSPNANISISSGNTDANEYGNFEYSPTVGGVDYYAMNTKNLAEFG
jgi:hypothetical protein